MTHGEIEGGAPAGAPAPPGPPPGPTPHPDPAPGPVHALPAAPRRIGLVAAGGSFPVLVAAGARRRGVEVVCVAHRRWTSPEVLESCRVHRYLGLGRLGAAIRFFRRHAVEEIVFAGWIRKERLFRPWRLLAFLPDWRMLKLWFFRVRNRQDHTLLAAVADEFERSGIPVAHSTKYCPELLAEEGVLTRRGPTKAQLADIRFGWRVAKRMADLDVGQSVAVSERATLSVEGIEGTDRNIRRAGELCRRGGFTVVKLAKEGHDMRFDVPAIGPETIDVLREAGGAVLAIEAGRTMLLDREETLQRANRHGIVVVSYRDGPPEA